MRHVRGRALLLAVAILACFAAASFAYWTAAGAGTTTTVLPDPLPVTFSVATPTAQLSPGGDSNVAIVMHNANAYFVRVTAMELDLDPGVPPFIADGAHSGCDVSVLSFIRQTNGGAGWNVPPKVGGVDGMLALELPSAILMSTAAANACQGATFTVRLVARD